MGSRRAPGSASAPDPKHNGFRRNVMKIRPLYDRILVKRLETGEMKKGGIIIPDTAKEKPMEAEVVAVGKGKVNEEGKLFPLDVKKGDRILIGKYAGTEIKIHDEEHLILKEEEVLAVVEK
jgi:chaperonin GroES